MADYPSSLTSLQILPSLDDCQFIDEVPSHLSCSICLGIIHDPHLLSCCGVKYCSDCIKPVLSQSKPCPKCREPRFDTMLDKEMQRAVLNLKVYCSHKDEGCAWVGEVRYLEGHLRDKCVHVGVACKYCSNKYSKQLINTHEEQECPLLPMEIKIMNQLRLVNTKIETLETECEYWKDQSSLLMEEMNEQKKKYKEDMEKIKAEVEEDRQKYQLELEELRKTVKTIESKSSEVHEKTIHSIEVYDKCIPWAQKCETYSENLSRSFRDWEVPKWQSPPPVVFSSSVPPCQFILSEFSAYCASGKYWYSPPFYSWPGGYKLCLKVLPKGEGGRYVSVGVIVLRGEYDAMLKWPILCLAKVKILNLLKNINHVSHDIMVESPDPGHTSPCVKKRATPSRSWFESLSSGTSSKLSSSPDSHKKLTASSAGDKPLSSDTSSTLSHQPLAEGTPSPPTTIARFISHASMSENPLTGSKYCSKNSVCFRIEQCLDVSNTCTKTK